MKNCSSEIASTFPENGKSEMTFFFHRRIFFYCFEAIERSEVSKLLSGQTCPGEIFNGSCYIKERKQCLKNPLPRISRQSSNRRTRTVEPREKIMSRKKKYPYECNVHVKKDETNANRG